MKIPKCAKKVFQGEIFSVYRWKQKNYKGETDIYEMIEREDTVEILAVTKQKKIIVLKQKQPDSDKWYYCLPGGRIDDGEKPHEAALRELKEETGHAPEKMKLWFSYFPSRKIDWNVYNYIAKGCSKKFSQNLDGGEKIEVKLCSYRQFLDFAERKNLQISEIRNYMLKAKYNKKYGQVFKKFLFSEHENKINQFGKKFKE